MTGWAQPAANPLVEAYIDMYRDAAIREMQRSGVPASIKLAQGILESGAGSSTLARASNNHFGIKCKSSWTGERVYHDDDEKGECFRKYANPEESYRDHSDFLRNQPRYASLFALDPTDYRGWAQGLKQAGYATNPRYPDILVQYIETYRLDEITRDVVAGRIGPDRSSRTTETLALNRGVTRERVQAPAAGSDLVAMKGEDALTSHVGARHSGGFRLFRDRSVLVRKGTSLLAVAEEQGLPLTRLLEWNDLDPGTDILPQDRMIRLRRPARNITRQRNSRWTPFGSTTNHSSPISAQGR
ncbi:MAG: N-acetylmuramoyl-L-alanine amidase [Chitinophagia bacterium]|nr:N-acetylmuramoyl-L-alanine amidase [Chitinophagia bacterium]